VRRYRWTGWEADVKVDCGTKLGARVRSLRGYLYVKVLRDGFAGGRSESTTLPWPGFAIDDSKGDLTGIFDCGDLRSSRDERETCNWGRNEFNIQQL
jgi:hypothetical protein